VVTALQEGDAAALDQINQPVFLCYPATPTTFQLVMAQWFRLANAAKGIGQHPLNQPFDPLDCFGFCFLPIVQIF
jgi:hypothetical protein